MGVPNTKELSTKMVFSFHASLKKKEKTFQINLVDTSAVLWQMSESLVTNNLLEHMGIVVTN